MGIAFSPDEKYLYVNNTQPKKVWMRYRVQGDGSLADAKVFYDATRGYPAGRPRWDEGGSPWESV